jgi:hypothetical protein
MLVCAATCVSALTLAAVPSSSIAGAVSAMTESVGVCGSKPVTTAHYTHVLWVWMENHNYSGIIGNSNAPYINSLAKQCGLATSYHNITHPSLPNYIAGTSGLSLSAVQKFSGDCTPSPTCSTSAASIFSQGESWKAYEVSMPTNCDKTDVGEYVARHNPPVYYTSLTTCTTRDVPYPQLAADLASGHLPAFSFVTPNLIDDMHDGTVAQGDAWLAQNLPLIFKSSEYTSGSLAVVLTWDEGAFGSSLNCATNTVASGCRVATIVISPTTKAGTSSSTLFNHWSLLRSTEELLHLPLIGQAAHATSMNPSFGL